MTTNSQTSSAKIYMFPARGRFARDEQGEDLNRSGTLGTARNTKTVIGSAWYHEEAIRQEDPTRKN